MDVALTKPTKNGDKHMKTINKYVGLDVHKDTTTIAIAESGRTGEVRLYGRISSDLAALEKVLRKIGGDGVTLHVVYEAGPTGFVVYRRLTQLEIECIVVAPSKTPQPQGPRQKTDRRDATQLARLHRAGELTAIYVPDLVDESVRDLSRARASAVHDLTRAKQRLKSFLLRGGYRYPGSANWSESHKRTLRKLTLPLPALRSVPGTRLESASAPAQTRLALVAPRRDEGEGQCRPGSGTGRIPLGSAPASARHGTLKHDSLLACFSSLREPPQGGSRQGLGGPAYARSTLRTGAVLRADVRCLDFAGKTHQ
jgi:hypothetical protein